MNITICIATFCNCNEIIVLNSRPLIKISNNMSCIQISLNIFALFIDFWDKLQLQKATEADIQDGKVIKSLMGPGNFLLSPDHAGLILNTDGVQAFASSKHCT